MRRLVKAIAAKAIAALVISASAAAAQEAAPPTPEQILEAWQNSPHADASAEPFVHWNDEGEVPGECAVCHSTPGFVAYVTSDRTVASAIDHPVPIGSTVECAACHDPAAQALETVIFPSGATLDFAEGAVCAVCHQGRASGLDVAEAASGLDEDAVSGDLGFINVHYSAAATTRAGAAAAGGYEYPGLVYAGPFAHVPPMSSCVDCHGPHDTAIELDDCTTCHQGAADLRAIRISPTDFDGDGDTSEGIGQVTQELHDRLGAAIRTYAAEVAGAPIAYAEASYPYFFSDTDADGQASADEAVVPNRYAAWTPRLLKAAYNYQFVAKDHGAFAHNPHYAMQLMIDSIRSLSEAAEIDASGLTRP